MFKFHKKSIKSLILFLLFLIADIWGVVNFSAALILGLGLSGLIETNFSIYLVGLGIPILFMLLYLWPYFCNHRKTFISVLIINLILFIPYIQFYLSHD